MFVPMRRARSQWITGPVSWPSDKFLCIARSSHHTAHGLYTPGRGLSLLLIPSLLFLGSCSKLTTPSPSPWGSAKVGPTLRQTHSQFLETQQYRKVYKESEYSILKYPSSHISTHYFLNKPDQPRSTRSGNSAGPFKHWSY